VSCTANRHQNEYTDINNPDPSVLPQIIAGTLDRNTAVPYAGYAGIKLSENDENGHYNSLQTTLHSRISKDLTLDGAFTYSKAMDPGTGGGNAQDMQTVSNPYDRAYDNGPSALDRRAVFVMHELDKLPVPKIAIALAIPLNTAYSRLRLARADVAAAIRFFRAGAVGDVGGRSRDV